LHFGATGDGPAGRPWRRSGLPWIRRIRRTKGRWRSDEVPGGFRALLHRRYPATEPDSAGDAPGVGESFATILSQCTYSSSSRFSGREPFPHLVDPPAPSRRFSIGDCFDPVLCRRTP